MHTFFIGNQLVFLVDFNWLERSSLERDESGRNGADRERTKKVGGRILFVDLNNFMKV